MSFGIQFLKTVDISNMIWLLDNFSPVTKQTYLPGDIRDQGLFLANSPIVEPQEIGYNIANPHRQAAQF